MPFEIFAMNSGGLKINLEATPPISRRGVIFKTGSKMVKNFPHSTKIADQKRNEFNI